MKELSERFWSASVEEIMCGYVYDRDREEFYCLLCGKAFQKGYVYRHEDLFCEAEKYCALHVEKEHPPLFHYLLSLDRKYTGLTEHTKALMGYFYQGSSDSEIVTELGGGSTSTIRNHRFVLREREKEARVFLALMGLLGKKQSSRKKLIPPHRTAVSVDDRYALTEEERDSILKACFRDDLEGRLVRFPRKEKEKIAVLSHIVGRFECGRSYTEKEVNAMVEDIFDDYVTIRRYLIEYGFMDRDADGSSYWVKV